MSAAGTTLLAIGTRKGLWFASSSDRRAWAVSEPHEGDIRFGPADGAALERIWQIQPGSDALPVRAAVVPG